MATVKQTFSIDADLLEEAKQLAPDHNLSAHMTRALREYHRFAGLRKLQTEYVGDSPVTDEEVSRTESAIMAAWAHPPGESA